MSAKLRIINHNNDHILVSADEPFRFEISLIGRGNDTRLIVYGYQGTETDMDQEPVIIYDGTEHDHMENMGI